MSKNAEVYENHLKAKFNVAAKILGLPKMDDLFHEAEKVVHTLQKEGFSGSEIGRALGFKDFNANQQWKNTKGTTRHYTTIQNGFRIYIGTIGWDSLVKATGSGSRIGKGNRWVSEKETQKMRKEKAEKCRERLMKLMKKGKVRNKAIVALRNLYTLQEIGSALGISRQRVKQIVDAVKEAS